MATFEAILVLLLAAVVLLAIADRLKVPYPVLLAVGGALAALSPVKIPISIDPSLALALFVAPVLLDAAYDTSTRDLRANWRPVVGLVLVAVLATTAAVAWIAHLLVPSLPWAAAIALGAIVAPPDASATTTVLKSAPLPHRIRVVLEGESLLNDASALLIYRLAVAAVLAGGSVSTQVIAPAFLLSVAGSVIAGPIIAVVWLRVTRDVSEAPSAIILQFVGTFGVWILAETIGLSPILTVVTYAVTVARFAPARTPARLRVPSYAVWETSVVVLSALAFVIVGLQLGGIITGASHDTLMRWLVFGGTVLATVIVVRLVWVVAYNSVTHITAGDDKGQPHPTWRGGFVVGWSGMRGIVTVAAALALPAGFPERDLLQFTAFAVTLGTLVLQGLTLRPILTVFDLHDDQPVDRETRLARVELAEAGLDAIQGDDSAEAGALRDELRTERRVADDAEDGDGRPILPAKILRGRVLKRRRERLLELRRDGTIGDDAFHRLEEELDFADLAVAQRT